MGEGSGEGARWRREVRGEGVVGPRHGSVSGELASLVRAGVEGRGGELSARVARRVGVCRRSHGLGEAGLMVMSEVSRWWARVRGSLMPRSELERGEGERGSEYGGDGGREDMGLWKEQKEWNESTLDERLADSESACMGSR